jgi:hypothetical protein
MFRLSLLSALSLVNAVTYEEALAQHPPVSHPWTLQNGGVSPYKNGAYTGPFTQLTSNFLDNTADPANRFGAEDKALFCNNQFVFIDLDITPQWYSYDGTTWTTGTVQQTVPCSNNNTLFPRDSGYTLGYTANPITLLDRLLLLGGSATDGDVYYSDDCGRTWTWCVIFFFIIVCI